MDYKIIDDKIIITKTSEFCPQHILDCGQIFSYLKTNYGYLVLSANKCAKIYEGNEIIIQTNDVNYFVNFFDLSNSYTQIKNDLLKKHSYLKNAINFGGGIRILNQDIFETIISFIVSANNNIKRIQKILFAMRKNYGTNMGEFYAFPTLNQLKNASIQQLKSIGLGYRAEYIYNAVRQLEKEDYVSWKNLSTLDLSKKLISLYGVGPKVADCIMLFAYGKKDVFPVDTWIEKVYCTYFEECHNRKKIRQNLTNKFKNLSGYAQQYLFYSQRSGDVG